MHFLLPQNRLWVRLEWLALYGF